MGADAERRDVSRRPRYRWALVLYDRVWRLAHGLDTAAASIGAVLSVEVRRGPRRGLGGGHVGSGELVAHLHLNTPRVLALHGRGRPRHAVGLAFQRELLASLRELARLAAPGGRLAHVRAFVATTIIGPGLAQRLGFELEPDDHRPGLRLVAAYQRALLACLHPAGRAALRRQRPVRAGRLWMSRERLLERYGPGGG